MKGKSAPAPKVEFTVGERYTNEKGEFEVISIQREAMVIRWQDGTEITTDIQMQRRIQDRREWERQIQEKKEAAAAAESQRRASRPKRAKAAEK